MWYYVIVNNLNKLKYVVEILLSIECHVTIEGKMSKLFEKLEGNVLRKIIFDEFKNERL